MEEVRRRERELEESHAESNALKHVDRDDALCEVICQAVAIAVVMVVALGSHACVDHFRWRNSAAVVLRSLRSTTTGD